MDGWPRAGHMYRCRNSLSLYSLDLSAARCAARGEPRWPRPLPHPLERRPLREAARWPPPPPFREMRFSEPLHDLLGTCALHAHVACTTDSRGRRHIPQRDRALATDARRGRLRRRRLLSLPPLSLCLLPLCAGCLTPVHAHRVHPAPDVRGSRATPRTASTTTSITTRGRARLSL
ncbi:hypothetical protein DMC30DRAFT_29294 [Rhodotorula diobovata]|uniref:Uncharacterized protein n=1 Tax=Rhodotorula diobovata TaxID=5288 RepID=A0A5C5FRQ2_9BASI|nr:hypothetical protein DMC30DRAFT_29294 [Rhodotorula diobovata]